MESVALQKDALGGYANLSAGKEVFRLRETAAGELES